ncbi:hypothetical protein HID58_047148 [Brassica napus]|uniref:G-box binding protein multifunctional mosaic region domain-containing protein n=3 Tax=Brassica TaxID=3705 RepID=A0ABQ8AZW9_BRANA|nr:hypothetical protein HID58_047148 [Brassica napus]CDY65620.1 BnaAnng20760D [Brassica napus]VDD22703.1 unnamed protein product [Brassica oleracea]
MNVVAGRMRNTTLGTNELILCSVLLKQWEQAKKNQHPQHRTFPPTPYPDWSNSMQAYYGGGGTPNPFFPSKDQAIFVGVKLAIIQR